jgi:hypothetical protein
MARHRDNVDGVRREQPDVNAPRVVTIDAHDVPATSVEHLVVEPHERGPVVGLDHGQNVSAHVVDDPGGHVDGDLVD